MGSFDVAVFTTGDLYNHCNDEFGDGFAGRDIAIDFIEGAFNRSSNHSVNTIAASDIVHTPTEKIREPFEAPAPCYEGLGDVSWTDLRDYWKFWIEDADCKDPHASGKDCNLLLSDTPNGGLGGGKYACSGGAFVVASNYSSYENYGFDPAFNKVDTILEEVGHCLVSNMKDEDYGDNNGDGKIPHDSGRLYSTFEGYTITPIGITGDVDYNNCGKFVDKDGLWSGDGWNARYSPCTEDYFQEKSP